MKRIYKTKTVNADGTKIKVRQVLFKGKKGLAEKVGNYVATARGWLGQALPLVVTQGMTQGTEDAFRLCFKRDPDSASVMTVKATLQSLLQSISQPHGIKVRATNDFGYVNLRAGGRRDVVNGRAFYAQYDDEDGNTIDVRIKMGEVHLQQATVLSDPVLAVITYIHEASHKYCNTDDFGDLGYFNDDTWADFRQPGLTWQNALRNADSYAFFVYHALKAKFHHIVVT